MHVTHEIMRKTWKCSPSLKTLSCDYRGFCIWKPVICYILKTIFPTPQDLTGRLKTVLSLFCQLSIINPIDQNQCSKNKFYATNRLWLKVEFIIVILFNAQQFVPLVSRSKDKNIRKINVGWRKTLRVRN